VKKGEEDIYLAAQIKKISAMASAKWQQDMNQRMAGG